MSESRKTSRKSNRTAGAAGRDAYDDFLDMMDVQPLPKKGASSGTKKSAASAAKPKKTASSEKSAGAKKSAPKSSAPRTKKPAEASAAPKKKASGSKSKAAASDKKSNAPAWSGMQDDWGDLQLTDPVHQEAARPRSRHAAPEAPVGRHSVVENAPKHAEEPAPRTGRRKSTGSPMPPAAKPAQKRTKKAAVRRRDDYDDFLDAAEAAQPARDKHKGSGSTVALLAGIICVLALVVWQHTQYQTFVTMKRAVEQEGFYSGTTVEGVDVSGMTLEQALEYWETSVEPNYSQSAVMLSNGAAFTAAELGYTSDYVTVLNNAFNAGRSGSLEERYAAISSRRETPVSYTVTRRAYSTDVINQCVAAIAEQVNRPAENAKIASFNKTTYSFEFTDEVTGSTLDAQHLATGMAQALDAGGGTVELVVQAVQPEVIRADIASQYGMITTAVTNASSSSTNRLANIRLALEIINGTCLEPGETFSFNGIVGERTEDRGFKSAPAYSGGTVVQEVGGGICQVSTTLFNAAVKADLEIVERHNHSLTVSYVDRGKDAAVNWGSQDLRFTNNSDDNVYICCYLTDDKRVRVGIFGKLLPNGETITVEGETTGRISYDTIYEENRSLPSGTAQVVQSGKRGYNAVAYKIRWDANGNQISKELLCRSSYRATNEVIEYGP